MNLPKAKRGSRALLVEGGGMKGAFAGGVLHSLNCVLPAQNFDLILGVSSGACSAAYYATTPISEPLEGEHKLSIWKRELAGRKLISILNPFRGKRFLDQKYLIDFLFREKYRIEKENFGKFGLPEFRIAVSNLSTHTMEYIRATKENIFDLLKAATSLPIATRGKHKLQGKFYSDAGVLNPLPLNDLIAAGYKDITVVLNSPIWQISPPLSSVSRFLSFPLSRKLSKKMKISHHFHFNQGRELAIHPPKGIKINIIAPEAKLPVGLITTKQTLLEETVNIGKTIGLKAAKMLKKNFKGAKSRPRQYKQLVVG